MNTPRLAALLAAALLTPLAADAQNWELVWSDEFEGDSVDAGKWSFQTGDGCPDLCGWGNGEEQYYQQANASVGDGLLRITAREESVGGRAYTSARMRTAGLASWTYGRIETRAKMPEGSGFWPAVWLLPEDNAYGDWAASGEIDLLEVFGNDPSTVHGTVHFGGESPQNTFEGGSASLPAGQRFSDDFHEFAIEWVPGEIRWFLDGELYHTQSEWYSTAGRFPAPFDEPFHLLVNLAVGGAGGDPAASTFPQSLEVDYVRVFQSENAAPTVAMNPALNGFRAGVGSRINLSATAADADAGVARVEFWSAGTLLGSVTQSPYNFAIGPLAEGCYTVRARAVDLLGGETWSEPVSFSAGQCVQAPVGLVVPQLPALIQAEAFDLGGEGVAYHDLDEVNTGNPPGGGIRLDEGVDLEYAFGNREGFYVSDFEPGEWLEYTVEVPLGRGYLLEMRASSAAGAAVSLHADGIAVVPRLEIAATEAGSFPTWFARDFPLEAGRQVIRVQVEEGTLALDAFTLRPNPDAPVSGVFVLDDYQSTAIGEYGFFGSANGSIAAGTGGNRYLRVVFSGSGGTGSTFYGVTWRNYPDAAQVVIPADPWFSARVRHAGANTSVVRYALEVTLREDTDGNGWSDGDEDSHRLDTFFDTASFNDEWVTISAPLSSFLDLQTGGNGVLEINIDEIVFVASQVEGPNPSSVEVHIDDVRLSTGPIDTGVRSDVLPGELRLLPPFPNPASGETRVGIETAWTQRVTLDLFDVLGRKVASVLDAQLPAGLHQRQLHVDALAPGIYFLRLGSGGSWSTTPLVVAR